MKHTPGEWKISDTLLVRIKGIDAPFYSIEVPAYCGGGVALVHQKAGNVEQSQANAALIAAAPELLEALKTALSALDACALYTREGNVYAMPGASQEQKRIEQAIAKAEGREGE